MLGAGGWPGMPGCWRSNWSASAASDAGGTVMVTSRAGRRHRRGYGDLRRRLGLRGQAPRQAPGQVTGTGLGTGAGGASGVRTTLGLLEPPRPALRGGFAVASRTRPPPIDQVGRRRSRQRPRSGIRVTPRSVRSTQVVAPAPSTSDDLSRRGEGGASRTAEHDLGLAVDLADQHEAGQVTQSVGDQGVEHLVETGTLVDQLPQSRHPRLLGRRQHHRCVRRRRSRTSPRGGRTRCGRARRSWQCPQLLLETQRAGAPSRRCSRSPIPPHRRRRPSRCPCHRRREPPGHHPVCGVTRVGRSGKDARPAAVVDHAA